MCDECDDWTEVGFIDETHRAGCRCSDCVDPDHEVDLYRERNLED